MKFRITCPQCGGLFDVQAERGELVACECPFCHRYVSCRMPLSEPVEAVDAALPAAGDAVTVADATLPEQPKKQKAVSGWVIFLIALLFVLVCLIVGTFILLRFTQPERYGGI